MDSDRGRTGEEGFENPYVPSTGRGDLRAVFAARRWVDAIRNCLIAIGAVACLLAIASWRTPDEATRSVVPSLVTLAAVALVVPLRRHPIVTLRAIVVVCSIAAVWSFVAIEPSLRDEWQASRRGADTWLFVISVFVFVVFPFVVTRFSRPVSWLGVLAMIAVFGLGLAICGFVDSRWVLSLGFVILSIGAAMALRDVRAAWPATLRYVRRLESSAMRNVSGERRKTEDRTHVRSPRASSGIVRSYGRWKALSRPSIRSGGVGALGLK